MGIPLSLLKEMALRFFQGPLAPLGYFYVPGDYTQDDYSLFYFQRQPLPAEHLIRSIDFHPSGLGDDNLFDLAIELWRIPGPEYSAQEHRWEGKTFLVRLAPGIWNEDDDQLDYWWHFTSPEELEIAFQDILGKLLTSGISFLEDPASTDWPTKLEKSFAQLVAIPDMNTYLRVRILVDRYTFGGDLEVVVENIGVQPIYFLTDKDGSYIKLFIRRKSKWIEMENIIPNSSTTGGDGFTTGKGNTFSITIHPEFASNMLNSYPVTHIRVLVTGEPISDEQKNGVRVGAYDNMTIGPLGIHRY